MGGWHLGGHKNILKRQLVHVGAFNLSLILRKLLGAGTPREWKNRFGRLVLTLYLLFTCRINQKRLCRSRISASVANCFVRSRTRLRRPTCTKSATCTPGCYPKLGTFLQKLGEAKGWKLAIALVTEAVAVLTV